VKHQEEDRQFESANVLLEAETKRVFGLRRQQRRLVVNLGIAKPVAVGALDVAARRQLDEDEAEGAPPVREQRFRRAS
jgi:hypothetical protein